MQRLRGRRLVGVELLHREREPVGQIEVVVVPDEEQVVRRQGGRGIHLLPRGPKALGKVDHLHLGMVELQDLIGVVVQHDLAEAALRGVDA